MNENNVIKRSVLVFIAGCILFSILGIVLKDVSYVVGFTIGYLLNLLVFNIIIKSSEGIITLSMPIPIVIMSFIGKLVIYAFGFYLAIKFQFINLIGVFAGYMTTKISIYLEGYKNKGGEIND